MRSNNRKKLYKKILKKVTFAKRHTSLSLYPIFKSEKPAFTYYDSKNIRRGVYTRDKFYFEIDTFLLTV